MPGSAHRILHCPRCGQYCQPEICPDLWCDVCDGNVQLEELYLVQRTPSSEVVPLTDLSLYDPDRDGWFWDLPQEREN